MNSTADVFNAVFKRLREIIVEDPYLISFDYMESMIKWDSQFKELLVFMKNLSDIEIQTLTKLNSLSTEQVQLLTQLEKDPAGCFEVLEAVFIRTSLVYVSFEALKFAIENDKRCRIYLNRNMPSWITSDQIEYLRLL